MFDDLDGVKCAIVEKNVSSERANFLKELLEFNGFTVIMIPSPPAKTAVAPPNTETDGPKVEPLATSFTVGVTDVVFNAVNAIFGRLLRTPEGHVVTLAYWNQKDRASQDWIPYYSKPL